MITRSKKVAIEFAFGFVWISRLTADRINNVMLYENLKAVSDIREYCLHRMFQRELFN